MEQSTEQLAPEGLITLLREQRDLYQRLQELSERQRRLISGDRPELLLNILRDRQTLVESLARINKQLSPYRRNWREIYDTLPEHVRDTASGLLEEINGMLQTILKADKEDQALLSARKQAVARSVSDVSGGQIANAAYAPRSAGDGGGGTADIKG
jgi:predicted component of type VI protein secretion system